MNIPYESTLSVEFHFADYEKFPFPEESFRKWILFIIASEKKLPGYLNYIFCSDEHLHEMNVQYLEHDTFTDVITFDYSEEFDNVSGDIFISIDRIKENAQTYNLSFLLEFARVLAHGVLHIIGYDDKDDASKNSMRAREDFYLKQLEF